MPQLSQLLQRIARLLDIRAVCLDTCFSDCQRSHADMRTGRINCETFYRHFPLAKSTPTVPAALQNWELELLIQGYTDNDGWFRLFPFQRDVEMAAEQRLTTNITPRNIVPLRPKKDQNSIDAIVGK